MTQEEVAQGAYSGLLNSSSDEETQKFLNSATTAQAVAMIWRILYSPNLFSENKSFLAQLIERIGLELTFSEDRKKNCHDFLAAYIPAHITNVEDLVVQVETLTTLGISTKRVSHFISACLGHITLRGYGPSYLLEIAQKLNNYHFWAALIRQNVVRSDDLATLMSIGRFCQSNAVWNLIADAISPEDSTSS